MRSLIAVCTMVAIGALTSTAAAQAPRSTSLLAGTANFVVRSYHGGPCAIEAAKRCETLRGELQSTWLGAEASKPWHPRCEIVLHPTKASYLQAVGRGGGQTSGSSFIRFEKRLVVERGIDLLVREQGALPALPHELTHVVLADAFGGRRPPRWADEGIATLADSIEKQGLHKRDCRQALSTGTALRLADVIGLQQFTSAQQVAPFYGQSLSLVSFLAKRDGPAGVVAFVDAAMTRGYDLALKDCYGIDGLAALERHWRDYAAADARKPNQAILLPVSQRR